MFLDKHNIKYKIVIQKPGDLIVTNVGCHHMVANLAPSIAYALNFSTPCILDYDFPPECSCVKRVRPIVSIDLIRRYEGLLRKTKEDAQTIQSLKERIAKLSEDKSAK